MNHLVDYEAEVYARLAELGRQMRDAIVAGFADGGIFALCTGAGPDLPTGSSLAMVHFPDAEDARIDKPEAAFDPAMCDVALRTRVLPPALLLEGVHMVEGHGAAATAHGEEDLKILREACSRAARRVTRHRRA